MVQLFSAPNTVYAALAVGLYPINYQVENTVTPSSITYSEVLALKGAINF